MQKKYLLLAALFGGASLSHAEYQIGDVGAVALGLDTSVLSTDNVTMDTFEDSDVVTSILPTLQFKSDGVLPQSKHMSAKSSSLTLISVKTIPRTSSPM